MNQRRLMARLRSEEVGYKAEDGLVFDRGGRVPTLWWQQRGQIGWVWSWAARGRGRWFVALGLGN